MRWWESRCSPFHKTLGSSTTTSLHSCVLAGREGGFYGVFCLKHLEKKEFVLGLLPDLHLGPGKSVSHTFINKVLVYENEAD